MVSIASSWKTVRNSPSAATTAQTSRVPSEMQSKPQKGQKAQSYHRFVASCPVLPPIYRSIPKISRSVTELNLSVKAFENIVSAAAQGLSPCQPGGQRCCRKSRRKYDNRINFRTGRKQDRIS